RVALGAQRPDILKLILGKGLSLAGTGIAIGLILSAISAPLIAGLLYGVHPIDVIVFVTVPLILLVVAFLATYIPARRGTIVDPIIALHESSNCEARNVTDCQGEESVRLRKARGSQHRKMRHRY